jgi:hypothetical protein
MKTYIEPVQTISQFGYNDGSAGMVRTDCTSNFSLTKFSETYGYF